MQKRFSDNIQIRRKTYFQQTLLMYILLCNFVFSFLWIFSSLTLSVFDSMVFSVTAYKWHVWLVLRHSRVCNKCLIHDGGARGKYDPFTPESLSVEQKLLPIHFGLHLILHLITFRSAQPSWIMIDLPRVNIFDDLFSEMTLYYIYAVTGLHHYDMDH